MIRLIFCVTKIYKGHGKFKLNENKTKLLEINMNNNIILKINNVIIEKVNSIKYLGFIIDKGLKFNDHIEFICKKNREEN